MIKVTTKLGEHIKLKHPESEMHNQIQKMGMRLGDNTRRGSAVQHLINPKHIVSVHRYGTQAGDPQSRILMDRTIPGVTDSKNFIEVHESFEELTRMINSWGE